MFFVINRDKIYAYCVSILTVILLFCVANVMTSKNGDNVVMTSSGNKELPIYSVETNEKKVSLTINSAWNDSDIDKILEVLKENDVKVTFFMVGNWVEKYPKAARKIKEAGHEIGSHSYSHPHVNNLSYEENQKEISKSVDVIKKITGYDVKLYRPPYGEYNNTVINVANEMKYVPIQWSLDTLDYTNITGEEMWKRLDGKVKSGDIILMHNGTKHTANSLDMIIKNIKKEGYKIVPVSELIYKDNYIIDINGRQKK